MALTSLYFGVNFSFKSTYVSTISRQCSAGYWLVLPSFRFNENSIFNAWI